MSTVISAVETLISHASFVGPESEGSGGDGGVQGGGGDDAVNKRRGVRQTRAGVRDVADIGAYTSATAQKADMGAYRSATAQKLVSRHDRAAKIKGPPLQAAGGIGGGAVGAAGGAGGGGD